MTLLLASTYAWLSTPHMISSLPRSHPPRVYAIARKDIKPAIWAKMQTYFAYMKENDANYPNDYEIACWPDDFRSGGGIGALNGWHYYDQAFYDGIQPNESHIVVDKLYSVTNTIVPIEN